MLRDATPHPRRRAIARVRISGCSVNFLTPKLDVRPIIAQAAVPVAADTPATLAALLTAAQQVLSTGPAAGGQRHGAPRDVGVNQGQRLPSPDAALAEGRHTGGKKRRPRPRIVDEL